MTTPERLGTEAARLITGLSARGLQAMAARGEVPGAAKLGKKWTFDAIKLRRWIAQRETECQTSTSAGIHGGAVSSAPAETIDAAYERAIRLRRSDA
jgi:hypothetical protein